MDVPSDGECIKINFAGYVSDRLAGFEARETPEGESPIGNFGRDHKAFPEFYAEYSRLWRHVLDLRYQTKGKVRTYVQLGAALATGKVSLGAVRKGMNMAKVFSRPETFLRAHREPAAAPGA